MKITIPESEPFGTMEKNDVIATRKGQILGLELFKKKNVDDLPSSLLDLDVINLKEEYDTNVIMNGYYEIFKLDISSLTGSLDWLLEWLGVNKLLEYLKISAHGYDDIDFQKLAVIGNLYIQQDKKSSKGLLNTGSDDEEERRFTFKNGLFVNKSLIIGGDQGGDYSKLLLRGDMVVMENLVITDTDLTFGDEQTNEISFKSADDYVSNIYAHGEAQIKNACIKEKNENYDFRLFTKGKLDFANNNTIESKCRTFDGLYLSEDKIVLNTHGKPMTINGAVFGDIEVVDSNDDGRYNI